jgi:hypothetical protein
MPNPIRTYFKEKADNRLNKAQLKFASNYGFTGNQDGYKEALEFKGKIDDYRKQVQGIKSDEKFLVGKLKRFEGNGFSDLFDSVRNGTPLEKRMPSSTESTTIEIPSSPLTTTTEQLIFTPDESNAGYKGVLKNQEGKLEGYLSTDGSILKVYDYSAKEYVDFVNKDGFFIGKMKDGSDRKIKIN